MEERLIEIKITKATLFLTEAELIKNLPSEILEVGLRRGKKILRARSLKRRFEKYSMEK